MSLQKVTEAVLKPWQKGIPRSSHRGGLLYAIVKPATELVKTTLSLLIAAKDTEVTGSLTVKIAILLPPPEKNFVLQSLRLLFLFSSKT